MMLGSLKRSEFTMCELGRAELCDRDWMLKQEMLRCLLGMTWMFEVAGFGFAVIGR